MVQLQGINMDLFDFFFPEQAQAAHLRKIARGRSFVPMNTSSSSQSAEISALQSDVKFLTLVLTVILKRLAETETLSLSDVQDLLDDVDGLDGVADGGLDPGVLRGLLGVLREDDAVKSEQAEAFESIAELHRRYRR